MLITLQALKAKDACKNGYDWVAQNYPDGCAYQSLLNALVDADHADWADWLLSKFGSTDTVYEADELVTDKAFVFAGSIRVKNQIKVEYLRAGGDVAAGGSIQAGDYIKAGGVIVAGGNINVGWDIGAGGYIGAGGVIVAGNHIKAGGGITCQKLVSGRVCYGELIETEPAAIKVELTS